MRGEWCYYKNYFTPEDCEKILNLGLNLPSGDATLGVGGQYVDTSFRKSQTRFIEKTNNSFQFLFDEMWKMAIAANDQWFGFHLSKIDYIQLAEYNSSYQGEYKKHHDVFWINNDPIYHRKLTAVVQLTDPSEYEGGDFEVYDANQYPNKEDIRSQGTVIFIPSFMPHAALPVTKGVRHSLACWFDGPKWR
jgi:PKHD-type hydroxylase